MDNIKIGSLTLKSRALSAPMAGISYGAFRELCVSFGAGWSVTEMVSSKALSFGSGKSEELMLIRSAQRPCGIQLFGSDPECMARAADKAMKYSPDFIDINMGCPAPKICKSESGCALMKDPDLCGRIVEKTAAASGVPVTVKIRKGWDADNVNAVETAQSCEAAGACAVTVHGKTREQYYKPPADYEIIAQVRRAVRIPVIANGDISSARKALEVMEKTGCELVMVGRAAVGNPWIFGEINTLLENPDKPQAPPSLEERLGVMVRHVEKAVEYKGEYIALRQARRVVFAYLRGVRDAARLRSEACRISTLDDLYSLRDKALRSGLR